MSSQSATPEVTWAQRSSTDDPTKNYVYVTIGVPDVPKPLKLDLTPTTLKFTGTSDTKKTTYHVEMEFYAEIDPDQSKINHTAANVQLVLRKKDMNKDYWPRLLKTDKKMHYLRTDFDKWVDEDEQDEAQDEDFMQQFGGMGGDGGFGGIDFSKLGGAGGDGGMPGMEGLGGEGEGDDDDDDDDDMPGLEDGKDGEDAAKGKAKIQEVPS